MNRTLRHVRDWLEARSPSLRHRSLAKSMAEASRASRRLVVEPARDPAARACVQFETSHGYELPVEEAHRYRLVRGPTYIAELSWLYDLEREGALAPSDHAAFRRIVGNRTLSVPRVEACEWSLQTAQEYRSRFVAGSLDAGLPIVEPDDVRLESHLAMFEASNRTLIERAAAVRARPPGSGAEVLEVGFTSGGHSMFALERLGYRVTGIDNLYGGIAERPALHTRLAERLGSKARFVFGDITQQTPFDDASFDMIFSISVLEHVSDLPAAFSEMRRLLKPDGLLLHRYNPFFAANGGHSWGALDCPWGHVRLSLDDHLRYLEVMRPNEVDGVRSWVAGAINREASLARVQKWLSCAGFRVLLWEEHPESPQEVSLLDADGVAQAFERYPFIGLNDLLTREVVVAAAPTG